MIMLLKIIVGLLFGLFAFVVPAPIGGEHEFAGFGRLAVLCGITFGLGLYFLRGRQWLAGQFRAKNWSARLAVGIPIVAGLCYLSMRTAIDTPIGLPLILELILYVLFSLTLAFALSIVGALIVERLGKK
jgi:hypothetical protein